MIAIKVRKWQKKKTSSASEVQCHVMSILGWDVLL